MTELAKALFLFLSALFPIVDPPGGAPIFLALTQGYSPETRRSLAWRIALDSFYLLMGSYPCPDHVERDQPAAVVASGLRPLGPTVRSSLQNAKPART